MAKFCTNCGAPINPGSSKCENCGKIFNNQVINVNNNINNNNIGKSKAVAILLAIFFGAIGVHNFYLGYNEKGITQLLISILSLGLLSPLVQLWAIIEMILIAVGKINCDASGKLLR